VKPFVVVGCSLGGFRAVGTLLTGLPVGFAAPIAIVQHRAAQGTEELCAAMQRCCALPVLEAGDKQRPAPGHVYIAPAGYHLLIDDEEFSLSVDEPVNYARPSIDVLFESASESFGARTIAVVLSGASRDGSEGARAVLERGGRVIVQDPAEAECRVMPAAAQHPRTVALALADIAPWLVSHAQPR
jgi:two-component system, chemotaxis family, protein-glutamate methylesterase/glutaminase